VTLDPVEVLVAGGAAAGCVLAQRLAEKGRSLDASVIPDAPSGFLHIVTIMVAEHLATRL
jgi:2-polyprenyl-6-methoxyphenol hydroxylase-like FAD-dependent oxidoreductase